MKFIIKHEMKGRMRVRLSQKRMTYEQADILQYYLLCNESVRLAKVYDRTCDAVINYTGDREEVIRLLQEFHYQTVEVPADVLATSGREVNAQYQEKLFNKVVFHYARKWFLPYPLNACYTSVMSLKYIWKGIKCLWARKVEVPVLDATAIGVSVMRGDFSTAGSVMFLLGIGEILEEWVTDGKPHLVEKLPVGEELTLREITAPEGYEIAEDVKFTLEDTMEIQKVEMKDARTPETPGVPQTGDNHWKPVLLFVLLGVSVAGLMVTIIYKKKHGKTEKAKKEE